jgi:(1->4)-alpha-D-glucan 1-alpha-D-glucosylmutase
MVPRATYRVQFGKHFGFDDAAALAPYLAELGISHLYASPYLKARPGSTHGYDITDHKSLNPELGDEAAFSRMIDAFKANGLLHILDYVPNHMGVGGSDNPFWLDLLEWGKDSIYADWFDVDWESHSEYLRNKLLVPFLANQYGEALAAGDLQLKFDPAMGEFAIWAHEVHKLPICPLHYSLILEENSPEIAKLRDGFAALTESGRQVTRRAAELKNQLAQLARTREDALAAVESSVKRFSGIAGQLESWEPLDELIQKQCWRPAYFRVAADDINYRRFFNINELAGIRMELPEVFEYTHRFILGLLRQGVVDGLRIDHIDGLFDPKAYLARLRESGGSSFYLVVEKILAHHESLRTDWPVDGTTGYEFASQLIELLIDPLTADTLTETYRTFTGESQHFPEIVRAAKMQIMENEMASELLALARKAARIARQNPATADFTENLFSRAIKEVIACFPVYRTYVDGSETAETDRTYVHWAIVHASRNEPELDKSIFDFLEKFLTCDLVREPHTRYNRNDLVSLAMKLQQYSGPVMAKGVEDTALFRYNRFVALNEVGSSPDQCVSTVQHFHKRTLHRAQHWPRTLLATSTHDTKHGEDARARLAALSLIPEEWASQVTAWSRISRARRGDVEAVAPPSRNDEYLFFQNLIATWPAKFTACTSLQQADLDEYVKRLNNCTVKSAREARLLSNWTAPNLVYEKALTDFITDTLNLERSEAFFANFLPFQERIAEFGVHNSLVQIVLKLTTPGVPDCYQGSELWDLNMVDPDNRRPIDYQIRRQLLARVKKISPEEKRQEIRAMRKGWQDGAIKLFVINTILEFRKYNGELFEKGVYEPANASGIAIGEVIAFTRRSGDSELLVLASKDARLNSASFQKIKLTTTKARNGPVSWRDLFTGRVVEERDGTLPLGEVFSELPVAVLSLQSPDSTSP